MGLKGKELGRRQRFEYRSGVAQHPQLRGVNKEDDPESVPTWQYQEVINAQVRKGALVTRGGQSKYNSSGAASDCIIGIYDASGGEDGGAGLAIYGLNFPNDSELSSGAANNAEQFISDPAGDSEVPSSVAISITSNLYQWTDGYIYFMGSKDSYVQLWRFQPSSNPAKIQGASFVTRIVADTGVTGRNIGGDANNLYLVVNGASAANTKVYRWDGQTLATDDTPNAQTNGLFCLLNYQESIVALYNSLIKVRASDGTWSSPTLPIASFTAHWGVSYKDRAYLFVRDLGTGVGGGQGHSIKWDGTSLTDDHTFTSVLANPDTYVFGGNVAADGLFYLSWLKHGDTTKSYLAKFDGTTWTDTFVTINTTTDGLMYSHFWMNYRNAWYYLPTFMGVETVIHDEVTPLPGIQRATTPAGAYVLQNDTTLVYDGAVLA